MKRSETVYMATLLQEYRAKSLIVARFTLQQRKKHKLDSEFEHFAAESGNAFEESSLPKFRYVFCRHCIDKSLSKSLHRRLASGA